MAADSTSGPSATATVPGRDPPFYDNLELSLAEAWLVLADAVGNLGNAFHQPVLATLGLDGAPRARVVVLRGVEPERPGLRFHTDLRTSKWPELLRQPRAQVAAYDARSKIQLRLSGEASLHSQDDPIAAEAWGRTGRHSRQGYRVRQAPGSQLEAPRQADFQADLGPECGRENFAVVQLRLSRIEWLYLSAAGHRRAGFDWDGQRWRGAWLVP